MIINVTDANKYVYHYTKAATALNDILRNGTLRFGQYSGTNDPKESTNWLFDFDTFDANRDLTPYNQKELSEWLSRELKHNTRMACFVQDAPSLTGNHLEDIFKRGFCKPRMWAQYAEKHTGVCLVFDRERLREKITKQFAKHSPLLSGPVKYVDRGIGTELLESYPFTINVDELERAGKEKYPALHLREHYRTLFFEKMTDWRDESELRWVAFSKSDKPLDLQFENALVGLVFGEDTSEEDKRAMLEITLGRSIHYQGLKWKNNSPWYDYGRQLYMGRGF